MFHGCEKGMCGFSYTLRLKHGRALSKSVFFYEYCSSRVERLRLLHVKRRSVKGGG